MRTMLDRTTEVRVTLRRLKQIRRLVDQEVTAQLVSAFILSRLDYCNAVLAGLPRSTLDPLQRVQNAAARLVLTSVFVTT